MFDLSKFSKVVLIHNSVDFRKGVVGLNYELYNMGYASPEVGTSYIFFNSSRKSLKILYFDKLGFSLWYKKSISGVYKIPLTLSCDQILSHKIFLDLLCGRSILESGFKEVTSLKVV